MCYIINFIVIIYLINKEQHAVRPVMTVSVLIYFIVGKYIDEIAYIWAFLPSSDVKYDALTFHRLAAISRRRRACYWPESDGLISRLVNGTNRAEFYIILSKIIVFFMRAQVFLSLIEKRSVYMQ